MSTSLSSSDVTELTEVHRKTFRGMSCRCANHSLTCPLARYSVGELVTEGEMVRHLLLLHRRILFYLMEVVEVHEEDSPRHGQMRAGEGVLP